jgi:V8-like Glu-specific endopeptidase
MVKKTDREKLAGILKEFDQELVAEALGDYLEEEFMQISYLEFGDPGDEVDVGDGPHIELDALPAIERIIPSENNLLPVHFLEEGAVAQRAVARVIVPGKWRGTGFMVSQSLLLTNNHVLPSAALANMAQIEFNYQLDYQGNPQTVDTYSLDANDTFYTNAPLDFTLVRVSPKCRWVFARNGWPVNTGMPGGELYYEQMYEETPNLAGPVVGPTPYPYLRPIRVCTHAGVKWGWLQLQPMIQVAKEQHLNVIQHPRSRRKEVALQDNRFTKIFANVLHYTTDTEPGSSGSPVFNNGWDLLALHHAAGEKQNGQWISNEGIRVDKIVADLRNHFSGSPSGDAVLAELGI